MAYFDHDYKKFPELTNTELQVLGFTTPHVQITEDFYATVVKVHDGDTVTLSTNFRDFDFPLRLLEIDAPELHEGGEQARDWLKGLIEGQTVQVLIDMRNRVGKYGRLLGFIMYGGMNVGQQMYYLGLVKAFGKRQEGEIPVSEVVFNIKQWF